MTMVSESALPVDKGLDRAHDDNVRIRRHKIIRVAITVRDRDRNGGLIRDRNVFPSENKGRCGAVCA